MEGGTPDAEEPYKINREVYSLKKLRQENAFVPSENDFKFDTLRRKLSSCSLRGFFKSFLGLVPIFSWLPRYKLKTNALADFVSGLTIGAMQIPQGMSYALLAGQHPVHGLYNSFIPAILYAVLGTSRHTSMGCFAIVSLMTGNAVSGFVPNPVLTKNETLGGLSEEEAWDEVYKQRIVYASASALVVGLFLLILAILHVGTVVKFLSDPVISAYTFANAIHIVSSQIKGLLGVTTGRYSGPLNLIWVIRDNIVSLTTLDSEDKVRVVATVIISAICIIFLVGVKEINARYKHRMPYHLFIPGEIIVVIVGTGISYGANLHGQYFIHIVGNIPKGLPAPKAPPGNIIAEVIGVSIPIAIVGYAVAVSIAKVFAKQFTYDINPNQELVAYGISNSIGSLFYCFPAFPSMSRSCVQVDSGGKTQIVSLISAIFILVVLLVIGPLFESMPKACLSSIIVVAMKTMLLKILDFKPLWKKDKLDALTWVVSVLATLLLDVVYGLVVAIAFSLLTVIFRSQRVDHFTATRFGDTELYLRNIDDKKSRANDNFKVYVFNGPLYYLNKDKFRDKLIKHVGVDPVIENILRLKSLEQEIDINNTHENPSAVSQAVEMETTSNGHINGKNIETIITDCSRISFVDSVGVKTLISTKSDFMKIGITLVLANCSGRMVSAVTNDQYVNKFEDDEIFPTVHDAILFMKMKKRSPKIEDSHL